MSTPRYRAWRFVHPEFDPNAESGGLRVACTGSIAMVQEEASVRQSILLLLSTMPGERVMRPDYGSELHRLVFSPNDETTAGLAIHYTRQALDRWEPRIDVLRLDAEVNDESPGRLDIVVEYRLRGSTDSGQLIFPLDLTPTEI